MATPLPPVGTEITHTRKSGSEQFHSKGAHTDFKLLEFWQWSTSDLVNNLTRGRLAEFIIGQSLGLTSGTRKEWDAFDLLTPAGLSIEVKSCAYLQSWEQKRPSSIVFQTPKTRALNPLSNAYDSDARRQAHAYIFALLAHENRTTLDPLDLDQWHFYPVLSRILDARTRSQHSITLRSLQALTTAIRYEDLPQAVHSMERELNLPAV